MAAHRAGDTGVLTEAVAELTNFRTTAEARRLLAELAPLLASRTFEDSAGPSPSWLRGIEEAAQKFTASPSPNAHAVYLVFLRHRDRPSEFGVYVGETSLTAEERFEKHKSGHKASKHVERHGERLLRPFFDHLEGISRDAALKIERKLADTLERAGYWVEGGH
jgi:hypothetical protein